ncbi:putative lipoprotein [Rhodococcus ruber BKS 20-38]|uniref:Putative lipoprotein n=1 Tax=Rhodococcus ruber BKS 20-38 TaxID=1278076 RepID=M2ZXH8_9NOCA|nr:putative lipoprotein [Rhodococcus ruber BKS 20-38]
MVVAVALVAVSCGGSDTGESPVSLTEPPQIARWVSVGGIEVPIGTTDGPRGGEWEPFAGFSHTPQGAALAAITQSVQLATASDRTWPQILSGVAAPGEGRDLYAAHRALVEMSGTDPEMVPTVVGYTIGDYSDTAVTVDVVQRFSDDSLASTTTQVVWIDGDWRLNLPSDDTATITALDALPSELVDLEETK